jgi:hypothetical protein
VTMHDELPIDVGACPGCGGVEFVHACACIYGGRAWG